MPTVPVAQSQAPERRIPGPAAGFLANESEMGGAVGRSLMDLGESVSRGAARLGEAHRQLRERRDAADADKALTAYTADMTGTLHGTTDPDGNALPGLTARTAAAATGAARDFTKSEYDWMNNPDGPRMKLTPSARKLFDTAASAYSSRFRQAATGHELAQLQVQRKLDTESAYSAADTAARAAIGTDGFDSFATEAAMRDADRKLHGQYTANPDGTRTFASPAAEQLHRDASAAALTGYRAEQARHFIDTAALGPLDPSDLSPAPASAAKQAPASPAASPSTATATANSPSPAPASSESYLARADAIAATLPPAEADKLRKGIYRARATRKSRARASVLKADADQREAVEDEHRTVAQIILDDTTPEGYTNPELTLAKIKHAARLDPAAAITHAERIVGVMSKQAEFAAKTAEERAKIERERDQNITYVGLSAGYTVDRSGNPVPISPAQQVFDADNTFVNGIITPDQRKDIIAQAALAKDKRVASFSTRAITEVLPSFTKYIAEDKYGNFIFKTESNGKIQPSSPTGWKDTSIDKKTKAVSRRPILLQQALRHLNVIKEKLATNPDMDADKAFEMFKSEIQGTAAEADKLTIEEHMQQHALDTANIRNNLNRLRFTPPPRP